MPLREEEVQQSLVVIVLIGRGAVPNLKVVVVTHNRDLAVERGLLGHSDADVLAHALADAILGACRGGDIGKLFPDTDPAYEGADSMVLLARVMDYARELGFEFVDADCTIACQQPKITPHRDAMRANLAHALGVDIENVGVAATTTEKLGWEGQGEGIGAWAVCLLQKTVKE